MKDILSRESHCIQEYNVDHTNKILLSTKNMILDLTTEKDKITMDGKYIKNIAMKDMEINITKEFLTQDKDSSKLIEISNELNKETINCDSNEVNESDFVTPSYSYSVKNECITPIASSPIKQANSLTQLDSFMKTPKEISKIDQQRPLSYHGHLDDDDNTHEDGKLHNAISEEQYVGTNKSSYSFNKLKSNRDFANNMFRKAASLCELQNVRMRSSLSKLENKFLSTEAITYSDDIQNNLMIHRLSYEDCSSCISCRSRSSSYHSLLYDFDTASNYQIYQPTVCDVITDEEEEEEEEAVNENGSSINKETAEEEKKTRPYSFTKDILVKQGHAKYTSLKEKLRKVKSLTS